MNYQLITFPQKSSQFNEFRLQGRYCDAVIRVEDVGFKIHRIILCDCSSYFRSLFDCQSTKDSLDYDIDGLSPDTMRLIIEFAYTGSVTVTQDNVRELMLAANMLDVLGVVHTCSNFLCEQLSPENCIGIWQFTNVGFSSELRRNSFRYIADHFEEVVPTEEFQLLTVQELTEILGRDELNVKQESDVFEAILRWIEHKPEERQQHIALLLPQFRMALSSMSYICTHVETNKLVKNNPDCMKTVEDAVHFMQHMRLENFPLAVRNPPARPRLPSVTLLAVIGSKDNNGFEGIGAYDVSADQWVSAVKTFDHSRGYHGTAFLDGYVYIIGGYDLVMYYSNMSRFDLKTHAWREVSPMHYCRGYVSVTVLNGYIYAIGGYDGHTRLSSAERYEPKANKWSRIAPMSLRRSQASCATLHDKIYICGGYDGEAVLRSAECYNPETNQWTMIASMFKRRCGVGVVAHAGFVYAVGGYDNNCPLRSAEVYNPQNNTWTSISSMETPRTHFGLEVINGYIYAVGGHSFTHTSGKIEYYDSTIDRWFLTRNQRNPRTNVSCCVVPCVMEYVVPRDSLPFVHLSLEGVVQIV